METAAKSDVARPWTRGLVLLALLLVVGLLTRCPIGTLVDTPLPPPSSRSTLLSP